MRIFTYRRAGAIVLDETGERVLLIGMQPPGGSRWYHVPGGGIEDGEDAADAARRELFEETGLVASTCKEYVRLGAHGGRHRYFLMTCDDLTLGEVTGPELDYAAGQDFRAEWVPIPELPALPIFPRAVVEHLAVHRTVPPEGEPIPELEDDRGSWDGIEGAAPPSHIRFTVRLVIVDDDGAKDPSRDGRVAAIRRARPGDEPFFTTPGGGIEPGESVVDAAVREAAEETGLEVEVVDTLGVVVVRFEEGRESLQTYLRCRITGGVFGAGTGDEYTDPERRRTRGTYEPVWLDVASLPAAEPPLRPGWLAERLPEWLARPVGFPPDRFCEFHDE